MYKLGEFGIYKWGLKIEKRFSFTERTLFKHRRPLLNKSARFLKVAHKAATHGQKGVCYLWIEGAQLWGT